MKLKRKLLSGLLILAVLLTIAAVTTVEAKTNMQIAQELIYGKWADVETGTVKYQFDENNVKILDASDVNPYGDSLIRVKRSDLGVPYTNCFISFKGNKYHLGMDNMRENGTAMRDGDHMAKYVKVY